MSFDAAKICFSIEFISFYRVKFYKIAIFFNFNIQKWNNNYLNMNYFGLLNDLFFGISLFELILKTVLLNECRILFVNNKY